MKRLVSGIMLTLLLTSMLTLAFNIQSARAEVSELAYDDGTAEAWGVGSISPDYSHLLAVCFESPWETTQLSEVKFYIAEYAGYSFRLHVMDNLKNDIYVLEVAPLNIGWFVVDLAAFSIIVTKNFYIGMEVLNTVVRDQFFLFVPQLGYDQNMPDGKSFWVIKPPGEEKTWKELDWSTFESYDMMIRATATAHALGDVNGDMKVDMQDISLLADAF